MDVVYSEIEKCILHTQDFQNITVFDRTFESNIVKGIKYDTSEVYRFTLHYEKCGKKLVKSFFVKIPYSIGNYQLLKQVQFFAKEIHMYKCVFPKYKSLLPSLSFHAEFYGTDNRDALILEDLSSGYKLVPGSKQMDFEHSAMALKMLARFHALSVKVHEVDPKLLEPVSDELLFTSALFQLKKNNEIIHDRLVKVVQKVAPTYAEQHPQVLHFLRSNSNFLKIVIKDFKQNKSTFKVLNHGDFHTNNIMFAYDMCGQVSHSKCIDFQMCRWFSPALDIMYFSVVSVRPAVFEKYFHLLLEIYVNTLNATLKYLACERELSIDTLLEDTKKITAYWLFALIGAAPSIVSEFQDGPHDGVTDECLDDHYCKLIEFWVPYFIDKGVFSKYEDTAIAIDQFTHKFEEDNNTTILKYDLDYDLIKPGDNYCSGIIGMVFEYQSDHETVQSSVLLKIPTLSASFKMLDTLGLFQREKFMYENILPKLWEWSGHHFAPICHTATQSQALVLEDLNAQGYSVCDRRAQLDLDHCLVALSTLAQYHGLSVKYMQSDTLNEILTQFGDDSSVMAYGYTLYDKFLQQTKNLLPEPAHLKLCEYKNKIEETLISIFQSGFSVITHGDFWTNNILFGYKNGKVHETKVIDWQVSRRGSPVLDLIFFFITSARFEVFSVHRDALLDHYVGSLNETLTKMACNCVYTRADLDKDLQRYKVLFPYLISRRLQLVVGEESSVGSDENSSSNYLLVLAKWLNYFIKSGII